MLAADPGTIFTEAFVARQRAKVQGVFSALTKPTAIQNLIQEYGFHSKLFMETVNQLIENGRLPGKLVGRSISAEYVIPLPF
jgi:hypothetical protein